MALLDADGLAEVSRLFQEWASAHHHPLPGTKTNVANTVARQNVISRDGDIELGTGGTEGENDYIQNNLALARQLKIITEQVRQRRLS